MKKNNDNSGQKTIESIVKELNEEIDELK